MVLSGILRNNSPGSTSWEFRQETIGVMLSDLRMPGLSGLDLLPKALGITPHLCVIMLTGYATVDTAVNALKEGAWDFITKPVEREALFHTVEKAVAHYRLATENKRLTEMIQKFTADQTLHFESHEMKQLMEKVTAISATDYTVLVTGESGSGKEYVARIIHRLSKRKDRSCPSRPSS